MGLLFDHRQFNDPSVVFADDAGDDDQHGGNNTDDHEKLPCKLVGQCLVYSCRIGIDDEMPIQVFHIGADQITAPLGRCMPEGFGVRVVGQNLIL